MNIYNKNTIIQDDVTIIYFYSKKTISIKKWNRIKAVPPSHNSIEYGAAIKDSNAQYGNY